MTGMIFGGLLLAVLAVLLFVAVYIMLQGDEHFCVIPEERGFVKCEHIDEAKAIFSCVLPFRNTGKQLAMVLDVFTRLLLPKEQFDMAKVSCRLESFSDRRDDGYMQAFLSDIADKGEFLLVLEIEGKDGSKMQDILDNMVDITLNVYSVSVGRAMPKTRKVFITIDSDEIKSAAVKGADV